MEEKTTHQCKNCSTPVEGQFCHFCGQRYHDHKESFGELVYEFISDFLHFDSRFFKTVLPLIFQPGKLTKSYNGGKQRSQFHPIRLYLFSSFVYFFLFFYFTNIENRFRAEKSNGNATESVIDSAKKTNSEDSLKKALQTVAITTANTKISDSQQKSNITKANKKFITLKDSTTEYSLSVTLFMDSLLEAKVTPEQYLEQQKTMSKMNRAGYFERIITLRLLKINLQGEEGKREFFKKLIEVFYHNIPKMLFFLLPVFAFFLKLLYFRKKEFYYVDHAVLSLHYFSLIFLLLTLSNFILDKIFGTRIFTSLAFMWITFYLLIAMKRIYGEKWGKTIFKFSALGFLLFFAVIITLIANMAWSALMM